MFTFLTQRIISQLVAKQIGSSCDTFVDFENVTVCLLTCENNLVLIKDYVKYCISDTACREFRFKVINQSCIDIMQFQTFEQQNQLNCQLQSQRFLFNDQSNCKSLSSSHVNTNDELVLNVQQFKLKSLGELCQFYVFESSINQIFTQDLLLIFNVTEAIPNHCKKVLVTVIQDVKNVSFQKVRLQGNITLLLSPYFQTIQMPKVELNFFRFFINSDDFNPDGYQLAQNVRYKLVDTNANYTVSHEEGVTYIINDTTNLSAILPFDVIFTDTNTNLEKITTQIGELCLYRNSKLLALNAKHCKRMIGQLEIVKQLETIQTNYQPTYFNNQIALPGYRSLIISNLSFYVVCNFTQSIKLDQESNQFLCVNECNLFKNGVCVELCDEAEFIFNSMCLLKCPPGTTVSKQTCLLSNIFPINRVDPDGALGDFLILQGREMVLSCDIGYVIEFSTNTITNSITKTCVKCSEKQMFYLQGQCVTSCPVGYGIFQSICYDICPGNLLKNFISDFRNEALGNFICTDQCDDNFFQLGGTCVQPFISQLEEEAEQCVSVTTCDPQLFVVVYDKSISSNFSLQYQCQPSCPFGSFNMSGYCVKSCPAYYFNNNETGQCDLCIFQDFESNSCLQEVNCIFVNVTQSTKWIVSNSTGQPNATNNYMPTQDVGKIQGVQCENPQKNVARCQYQEKTNSTFLLDPKKSPSAQQMIAYLQSISSHFEDHYFCVECRNVNMFVGTSGKCIQNCSQYQTFHENNTVNGNCGTCNSRFIRRSPQTDETNLFPILRNSQNISLCLVSCPQLEDKNSGQCIDNASCIMLDKVFVRENISYCDSYCDNSHGFYFDPANSVCETNVSSSKIMQITRNSLQYQVIVCPQFLVLNHSSLRCQPCPKRYSMRGVCVDFCDIGEYQVNVDEIKACITKLQCIQSDKFVFDELHNQCRHLVSSYEAGNNFSCSFLWKTPIWDGPACSYNENNIVTDYVFNVLSMKLENQDGSCTLSNLLFENLSIDDLDLHYNATVTIPRNCVTLKIAPLLNSRNTSINNISISGSITLLLEKSDVQVLIIMLSQTLFNQDQNIITNSGFNLSFTIKNYANVTDVISVFNTQVVSNISGISYQLHDSGLNQSRILQQFQISQFWQDRLKIKQLYIKNLSQVDEQLIIKYLDFSNIIRTTIAKPIILLDKINFLVVFGGAKPAVLSQSFGNFTECSLGQVLDLTYNCAQKCLSSSFNQFGVCVLKCSKGYFRGSNNYCYQQCPIGFTTSGVLCLYCENYTIENMDGSRYCSQTNDNTDLMIRHQYGYYLKCPIGYSVKNSHCFRCQDFTALNVNIGEECTANCPDHLTLFRNQCLSKCPEEFIRLFDLTKQSYICGQKCENYTEGQCYTSQQESICRLDIELAGFNCDLSINSMIDFVNSTTFVDFQCLAQCPEQFFYFKGYCVQECPLPYGNYLRQCILCDNTQILNRTTKQCVQKSKCLFNNFTQLYDQEPFLIQGGKASSFISNVILILSNDSLATRICESGINNQFCENITVDGKCIHDCSQFKDLNNKCVQQCSGYEILDDGTLTGKCVNCSLFPSTFTRFPTKQECLRFNILQSLQVTICSQKCPLNYDVSPIQGNVTNTICVSHLSSQTAVNIGNDAQMLLNCPINRIPQIHQNGVINCSNFTFCNRNYAQVVSNASIPLFCHYSSSCDALQSSCQMERSALWCSPRLVRISINQSNNNEVCKPLICNDGFFIVGCTLDVNTDNCCTDICETGFFKLVNNMRQCMFGNDLENCREFRVGGDEQHTVSGKIYQHCSTYKEENCKYLLSAIDTNYLWKCYENCPAGSPFKEKYDITKDFVVCVDKCLLSYYDNYICTMCNNRDLFVQELIFIQNNQLTGLCQNMFQYGTCNNKIVIHDNYYCNSCPSAMSIIDKNLPVCLPFEECFGSVVVYNSSKYCFGQTACDLLQVQCDIADKQWQPWCGLEQTYQIGQYHYCIACQVKVANYCLVFCNNQTLCYQCLQDNKTFDYANNMCIAREDCQSVYYPIQITGSIARQVSFCVNASAFCSAPLGYFFEFQCGGSCESFGQQVAFFENDRICLRQAVLDYFCSLQYFSSATNVCKIVCAQENWFRLGNTCVDGNECTGFRRDPSGAVQCDDMQECAVRD